MSHEDAQAIVDAIYTLTYAMQGVGKFVSLVAIVLVLQPFVNAALRRLGDR